MAKSTPTPPAAPASDPVTQTLALLQPWIEYVPQRQRRLGRFIFIALCVHTAAFYFIRIDTTRAELRHETRIHVSVESPHAVAVDGAPADNFWDRLIDPRLFLLPLKPPSSFTTDQPALGLNSNLGSKDLPAAAAPEAYRTARAAVTPLESRIGDAMQPPRQPFRYDEKSPAVAAQTTWQWDGALAARQPTGGTTLPSPVSDIDLTPTVLSVSVNGNGTVQNVMVEESCGGDLGAPIAKELNLQAVLAARKTRFQPATQPGLQWGRMTVFWRYTAKPREEVVPTPPSTGP